MDYKQKPSRSVDMSGIVREAQKYEAMRAKSEQCGLTAVQAVNCIVLNEILHSGVVTHVCQLPDDHTGNCRCCGYKWRGK